MSARLFILPEYFLRQLFVWFERGTRVSPNVERERADAAEHRHHRAKQKPDSDRHVLSRFAILGAVTKWTGEQRRRRCAQKNPNSKNLCLHEMIPSRFIFR